jgi:hypothetical protein
LGEDYVSLITRADMQSALSDEWASTLGEGYVPLITQVDGRSVVDMVPWAGLDAAAPKGHIVFYSVAL